MAPKNCCVKGCFNNTEYNMGLSFFSFPKEHERCLTWAKNCGREDIQNVSPNHLHNNYRVCCLHFEENMFSSLLKNRLKKNAIPTIFALNMQTATKPQPEYVPERLKGISEDQEVLRANTVDSPVQTETPHTILELFLTSDSSCKNELRSQERKLLQQKGRLKKRKINTGDQGTNASKTAVSGRPLCCHNQISFQGLPGDEEARKSSENLLQEKTLSVYIRSMHFPPDSCQSPTVQLKETLIENAVPTFNHSNDTELVDSSVSACRCRTCLEVIDTEQCLEITEKCYSEKTIKEAIIILVPEMRFTIFDGDRVCKTCYEVLKSSLKFIERCLEVELTIAKENKQFGESDNLEDDLPSAEDGESEEKLGDLVKSQVDLEHNYDMSAVVSDRISPKLSTDSENTRQHNAPLSCDPLSVLQTIEDEYDDDIVIEQCDLLTEPKIYYLDSAVNVLKEEVTFSCQTCSEKFSAEDYKLHVEVHPAFICEHCGKGFKTRLSYTGHLRVHNEECRMLCYICGKFVKNGLTAHISSHDNKRPYMCCKCSKSFKTERESRHHEKAVHKKLNRQQCHECGLTFQNINVCRLHYRLKHLKLTPFVCHVCGREFGRKDYLQNHMHRHTSEPRRGRDGKVKRGRINKKIGFRLKHPGKPVNCKICGKEISTLNYLRTHLQSHTKIKNYKCRHCNLPYTTSANRDRHEKSHEVDHENKFRCNICWKRTKTEEELEVHLRVHEKRPPKYSCDTCGEKFYRQYLLNNHCISKHLSPDDVEKAEKEIVQNLLEYADPDF